MGGKRVKSLQCSGTELWRVQLLTAWWGEHSRQDVGWRTVLEWYKPANMRRAYCYLITSSEHHVIA